MTLLRGALIEYGSDFLGPIPNVVIFQFNPETFTRTIQVPTRGGGGGGAAREMHQAGEPPVESFEIKAEFDAAYQLDSNNVLARAFGIGPQLSALEKMVQPSNVLGGLLGAAVDAIGDALGIGGGDEDVTQPIPRESFPRILFIWGLTRVLPVVVESMTITELQYDNLLNPTQAEVSIRVAVTPPDVCSGDLIAQGAMTYTTVAKEAQAAANLANTVVQALELIPI